MFSEHETIAPNARLRSCIMAPLQAGCACAHARTRRGGRYASCVGRRGCGALHRRHAGVGGGDARRGHADPHLGRDVHRHRRLGRRRHDGAHRAPRPAGDHHARHRHGPVRRPAARHDDAGGRRVHAPAALRHPRFGHNGHHHLLRAAPRQAHHHRHAGHRHHQHRPVRRHGRRQGLRVRLRRARVHPARRVHGRWRRPVPRHLPLRPPRPLHRRRELLRHRRYHRHDRLPRRPHPTRVHPHGRRNRLRHRDDRRALGVRPLRHPVARAHGPHRRGRPHRAQAQPRRRGEEGAVRPSRPQAGREGVRRRGGPPARGARMLLGQGHRGGPETALTAAWAEHVARYANNKPAAVPCFHESVFADPADPASPDDDGRQDG